MVNQALGIHIIRCVGDVERIILDDRYAEIREWVMQRYIDRPLLLGGCKFHIRVYVLAVGNLAVYMWDQMLALIAVEKYQRDEDNRAAHITNTCANAAHPDFNEEDKVRLLSEVLSPEELAPVLAQMQSTIHDLFSALHSEPTVFLAVPGGFELFGFDFLLDEQRTAFFLEANAGPDFAMTGHRLHTIVNAMMEQTFKIAVDPFMDKALAEANAVASASGTTASAASAATPSAAATPAASVPSSSVNPEDKMQGSFIKCYEVINSTTLSMNFY